MELVKKAAIEICEQFEELLRRFDLVIDTEERRMALLENGATEPVYRLHGKEQSELEDIVASIVENALKKKEFPFVGYYVSRSWNYIPDAFGNTLDNLTIGRATENDLEYDGQNVYGRSDGFEFRVFPSLDEALAHVEQKYGFTKLEYDKSISEVERGYAVDYISKREQEVER